VKRLPNSISSRVRQRGNALVYALLAMVVTALVSVSVARAQRVEQKHNAGVAEATILDNLRAAANTAISEQVLALQLGSPLTKFGISVAPVIVGANAIWRPTIAQIVAMGYLPPGWAATKSTLNSAPYLIEFKRMPIGCVPALCSIEGQIVLSGPIRDTSAAGQMDNVAIGPILTRIGADSGVSLQTNPNTITGFGNTWSIPNPVAGTPAGVVAIRIGTSSNSNSQFVRINDTRDPTLQGNLTVAGNVSVGGTTNFVGATTFNNGVTLKNSAININAADGTNCVQILPSGSVNIKCAGELTARTGAFTDGAGNTTSIVPGAITTTGDINVGGNSAIVGKVSGNRLQPTGSYSPGMPCSDSNALASNAINNGLVLCSGGAWRAIVTQSAVGQACAPTGSFAQQDGAALICQNGIYVPLAKFTLTGVAGATCSTIGVIAVDVASSVELMCHANPAGGSAIWFRLNDLVSNLQFISSYQVVDQQVIYKSVCGTTAGYSGKPSLVIIPSAEGSTNSTFNRYAIDNGPSWTVYLRDSTGTALAGANAIAMLYCYYP